MAGTDQKFLIGVIGKELGQGPLYRQQWIGVIRGGEEEQTRVEEMDGGENSLNTMVGGEEVVEGGGKEEGREVLKVKEGLG